MDSDIPTKDEHYKNLSVGTFVRTVSFDLKESRYYFDERKRDWINFNDVRNMGSNLFPNYEGYALVHPSMIENIFNDASELG